MKIFNLEISKNDNLSKNFSLLELKSNTNLPQILPGQFLNIYLNDMDHLVPRPFSIFSYTKKSITVFYKIVGCGTKSISNLKKGDNLKVLLPLGNFFPLKPTNYLFLIAGGIGIAPIHAYLTYLKNKNFKNFKKIKLFYGAKKNDELYFINEFKKFGIELFISTDDGSFGAKGNVIDSFINHKPEIYEDISVFSCGPKIMLENLYHICKKNSFKCYLSLEESMGCGFGACVGCVTKSLPQDNNNIPYKLVCKDGPIFEINELRW